MVSFSDDPAGVRAGVMYLLKSGRTIDDEIAISNELALARLTNERATENRIRYGTAAVNGYVYATLDSSWPDSWKDQMTSWLIPVIAGVGTEYIIQPPPAGTSRQDISFVANLIFTLFRSRNGENELIEELLRLLLDLPRGFTFDFPAIVSAVQSNPELLEHIPELMQLPGFQSIWDGRDQRQDS